MRAFNFITNTEYAGANALLQGNGKYPAFASYRQLNDMGYQVNKGAKSVGIFCGYRNNKDGESVPCWGRVFDIIDTTAINDPDCIDFIEHGTRQVSELQVDHEIIGALNGGSEGRDRVQEAYDILTKPLEVSLV
jgi:hypothetical protein